MHWTDEQRRAIETTARSVCVDAGAGSGKTRVLIDRLVRLLDPRAGGVPFDRIVAITFTNKAAAEMRSRLREAAFRRVAEGDGASRAFWRDLERKLDGARIMTIDAFCLKLLKEHALRLGLDPEFSLMTEAESTVLQAEVITRAVTELFEREDPAAARLAAHFAPYQMHAMLDTMLAQRETTETAIGPWRDLPPAAIAEKATETADAIFAERIFTPNMRGILTALRDDLAALVPAPNKEQDLRVQSMRRMIAVLDEALAAQTVQQWGAAAEKALDTKTIRLNGGSKKAWVEERAHQEVSDLIKSAREVIERAKVPTEDKALTAQAAQFTHDLLAVYTHVTAALDAEKHRRQAFYFDDIVRIAVTALRENEGLRREVAAGIDHLLIDEFQDTDPRQLVLANLLHHEENGPATFIVGDAKQSIYRFRGAEVTVFSEAREAAAEEILMKRNHRTVPGVLRFVNNFFTHSEALAAVENPYLPMEEWRPGGAGARVEFLFPELDPDGNNGAPAQRAREAELIAHRLVAMCEKEPVPIGDGPNQRPANYGDAAILLRALSDVAAYERALREAGVPYYVVAGRGFYERQEVIDLRNLLAVIADPFDEIAVAGYLRGPIAGLSDDALFTLTRGRSLSEAFADGRTPPGFAEAEAWEQVRALVTDLRTEIARPLPEFVARVLTESGYEAMLLPLFLGESRAANVRKVVDLAAQFAAVEGASLRRFVTYMDDVAARAIQEGEAGLHREGTNAVAILTIHKSKGLEFPIVFVPDLGRGLRVQNSARVVLHRRWGMGLRLYDATGESAPSYLARAIDSVSFEQERAEQMRILYVAMTRAQDWLVLSAGAAKRKPHWLEVFDAFGMVVDKMDGHCVKGDGWEAVVRRTLPALAAGSDDSPDPDTPIDREAAARRVAPIAAASARGGMIAVTRLLTAMQEIAGHEMPHGDGAPADPDTLIDGRLRGIMVHRLLECWDGAADPAPVVDRLLRDEFPLPEARTQRDALLRAAAFVGACPWAEALGNPATRHEQPFHFRLADDTVLEGVIDAILPDGTLIDWKTGAHKPESHARYAWQVRLYAAAAQALDRSPPAGLVVYVDTEEVVPVDLAPEAIAQTLALARRALDALRTAADTP